MIDKSVIESIISDVKKDIELTTNEHDPNNQSLIDELTSQLHKLETLLAKFPYTYPEPEGTLGHHVRHTIIESRCLRLQKLFDIKAPFVILYNEVQALIRCMSDKPIQNWLLFKDLKFLSFIERPGHKGKKYMLIYTPTVVVYLFQGRFGPWLTTDAIMDAKKAKKSKQTISE